MRDIYRRLATVGFDRDFLRDAVLPEWWDDSLAEVPANRAMAELYIARSLGMSVIALGDPSAPLKPAIPPKVKFKRFKRQQADERVRPAIMIAQRAARIAVSALTALPDFDASGSNNPAAIRKEILASSAYVDLRSLLEYCWRRGIVVMHLAKVPTASRAFDGLAMYCGKRPVLVLGSKRDSPAWLAFHLAHELAHILRQHVTEESGPLADTDLTVASIDREEAEADSDACELLTGDRAPKIPDMKLNAQRLAQRAMQNGLARGIDPGMFVLIYGKCNNRFPVAQLALQELRLDSGARALIGEAFKARINADDLSEASERFVSVVALS